MATRKQINVEERLLGMMAVEKRFISEKQLTECLNILEFFDTGKSLEAILLSKEYLTQPQIERLRQQLHASTEVNVERKNKQQKRFGDVAVEQNMIDSDQLQQGLDEQEVYMQRGVRVQIGQIIHKKGFLTLAQVKRVLESQLKKLLYCKNCKSTCVIHSYDSGQIYQCENCKWDLIEAKVKKVVKQVKPVEEHDEDDEDDVDDGIGKLDILEL